MKPITLTIIIIFLLLISGFLFVYRGDIGDITDEIERAGGIKGAIEEIKEDIKEEQIPIPECSQVRAERAIIHEIANDPFWEEKLFAKITAGNVEFLDISQNKNYDYDWIAKIYIGEDVLFYDEITFPKLFELYRGEYEVRVDKDNCEIIGEITKIEEEWEGKIRCGDLLPSTISDFQFDKESEEIGETHLGKSWGINRYYNEIEGERYIIFGFEYYKNSKDVPELRSIEEAKEDPDIKDAYELAIMGVKDSLLIEYSDGVYEAYVQYDNFNLILGFDSSMKNLIKEYTNQVVDLLLKNFNKFDECSF